MPWTPLTRLNMLRTDSRLNILRTDPPRHTPHRPASTCFPPFRCAKCYQPCETELRAWLPADEIRAGLSGRNFFCLRGRRARPFKHGQCVLNTAA